MKYFLILSMMVLFNSPVFATHLFRNSASNLNTGTVPNERIDGSSITKQGNSVKFSLGTIIFGDGSVQNTAAGSSQWTTNTDKIYNSNAGNVGIGTTDPGAKLELLGTLIATGTSNLASVEGNVGIGTTGSSSRLDVFGGSLTIRGVGKGLTVGTTDFVVNKGNVGIGTLLPSSSLDIFGGSLTVRGTNSGVVVNGGSVTAVGFSISAGGIKTADNGVINGVANEAQTRAFTSSTVVITPALQSYHPGVAKAWGVIVGTSASEIHNSYNIDSFSNDGGGVYTITLLKPMLSNKYSIVPIPDFHTGGSAQICQPAIDTLPTTTVFKIFCSRTSTEGGVTPNRIYLTVFGDQ